MVSSRTAITCLDVNTGERLAQCSDLAQNLRHHLLASESGHDCHAQHLQSRQAFISCKACNRMPLASMQQHMLASSLLTRSTASACTSGATAEIGVSGAMATPALKRGHGSCLSMPCNQRHWSGHWSDVGITHTSSQPSVLLTPQPSCDLCHSQVPQHGTSPEMHLLRPHAQHSAWGPVPQQIKEACHFQRCPFEQFRKQLQ